VLEGFRADGWEVADLSGAGDPVRATAAAIPGDTSPDAARTLILHWNGAT